MMHPLIIVSPGRSGSSWVAGNFVQAGVFGGDMRSGDKWNPGGYFENRVLHRKLREIYGQDWVNGPFPDEHPDWHQIVVQTLKSEGYAGGPWMFKGGAFYWKTFASFDPIYVKVWRDLDKILASFERCGFLGRFSKDELAQIVMRQHEEMKTIPGLDVEIH